MLNFDDQTYANILQRQLDRVTNSIDKREGSLIQTALGPESWAIEGIYLILAQLQENAFALTAVGEFLDYKAAERGITRLPAVAAQRQGEFNVEVPIGARFSTINGTNSVNFTVTGTRESSNEYYWYTMLCETPGAIGNDYTGSILPITPIAGLTYAQITTIIIAGSDEEDDDALRQRYLLSLEEQVFAGNIAAYQTEILKQPEVGAVQVYPSYPTAGYVRCSIIDSNYDTATPDLIEQIQMHICPPEIDQNNPSSNGYGFAPVGAIANIVTATEVPINITMDVNLTAGTIPSDVQSNVETVLSNYLLSVRRSWGNMTVTTLVQYNVFVYVSRIIVELLTIPTILNVTNVTLNGNTTDLQMTESGATQEIPVLGMVTLNAI